MAEEEEKKPTEFKPYRMFSPVDPAWQGKTYRDLAYPKVPTEAQVSDMASSITYMTTLGVGTSDTSDAALTAQSQTLPQLILKYDDTDYAAFTVDSSGNLTIDPTGNLYLDPGRWLLTSTGMSAQNNLRFVHGTSALATNATEGFLHLQSCAGTPTGTPATIPTGQIPTVIDSTNKLHYGYIDGAWTALSPLLTAKGDLLTRDSTDKTTLTVGADGTTLVADASTSTGLHWMTFQSFWFGTGNDGSSTLGSDTTLAVNLLYLRSYTTLDLASFTIIGTTGAGSDKIAIYCCSVLLTGSGGSILANKAAQVAGGAARVQGGSSGAGGTAGGQRFGLFVFARKVSGTVTVDASGEDGGNGGNASGVPTGVQTGAAGTAPVASTYFGAGSVNAAVGVSAGGGGAAGGTAGGAGTPFSNTPENNSGYYDTLRFMIMPRNTPLHTTTEGTTYQRIVKTPAGASGASGGITSTTAASGGGGGGGSASMGDKNGVAGGAGGAGAGTIGAGGGGGGGGQQGSFCGVMVGEFAAASTMTVDVTGGNGGNGGNGVSNGGGGGGGCGGVGGIAHAVLPVNYATNCTFTITAAGGTKGTKGLKAGTGTDGSDGNNGNDGHTYITTWYG